MHCPGRSGKDDPAAQRPCPMGPGSHTQKGQGGGHRSVVQEGQARAQTAGHTRRTVPKSRKTAGRNKRRPCRSGPRAVLVKKKNGLGLLGALKGHFKKETRTAVVESIKEAVSQGLTQKRACRIFGIEPRKLRRWANPKPLVKRIAWNRILAHEREAIVRTATEERFWDKPVSHIFVHGHESGRFFASLSTVYKVLKSERLLRPIRRRKRNGSYVSAHSLLDQGFSLLCYDATCFVTETGIAVWAIPVMILPCRYLLHIGYSLTGVTSSDLVRAVTEALALMPPSLELNLVAHSDRGSAMKAAYTRITVKDLLGALIHYGRPHTPDDEGWIEAFIKTLKYHREAPVSFKIVDDVVSWLARFPDLYNNDPHSSLKYVTPLQALSGQQEVILNQRKQNLVSARKRRYAFWQKNQPSSFIGKEAVVPASLTEPPSAEVAMQLV